MLQYVTSSWHYKLVNYVYGKSFFFKLDLDYDKIDKERTTLEDKTRREYPNDDAALEKTYLEFHTRIFQDESFKKYTQIKKTSFCPYCRAVLSSLILFPFVVLYRLIPKGKPKKFDLKERRKRIEYRSRIIRVIGGGVNIALGVRNIFDDSMEAGIIQIVLGIGIIFIYQSATIIRKIFNPVNFCYKKIKKLLIDFGILKGNTKTPKPQIPKTPNFIQAFFTENHSKYCPPVAFVDEGDK